MVLVTAGQLCQYQCVRIIGSQPKRSVLTLDIISSKMKSELGDKLNVYLPDTITNAFDKKREEVKQKEVISELFKNLDAVLPKQEVKQEAKQEAVVEGGDMEEEVNIDNNIKDIKENVIKNKSKSIIQKLLNREKKRTASKKTPIKISHGGGLAEI